MEAGDGGNDSMAGKESSAEAVLARIREKDGAIAILTEQLAKAKAEIERIGNALVVAADDRATLAGTLFGLLPDELLIRVLGFLPMQTVYGVANRVCRRWYELVAATPAIAAPFELEMRFAKYASGFIEPDTLEAAPGTIWDIVLSPDERRLYGATSTEIWVWSTEDFTHVHTIATGQAVAVWHLAMSDDGRLYSGSKDGTVRVWSTTDHSQVHAFPAHGSAIRAMALPPRSNRLYVVPQEGGVWEWSTDNNSLIHEYARPIGDFPRVAVSSDGARL